MFGKIWRRVFHKKIKTKADKRFEDLFAEATKVTPLWVERQRKNLTEIARREDTVTDATIILYRDRHGGTLACEHQRTGKKVGK